MNWRLKCLALHALSRAPWLYRAVQRSTGTAFLTVSDAYYRLHQWHVDNYRQVHPGRALEFGGGRHFLSPLLLSHAGATEVLVYDLERLSSCAQINHTIRQLRGRCPGAWPEIANFDELERMYRIRYLAPADARATGLPDASVDFVCSTSTLEHIPPDDIRRIHGECVRVARQGAVFSHIVDYQDHYCYADKSLSPFNFYRYGEQAWRWFNPANHFQNRLRHSDYERLFAEWPLTTIGLTTRRSEVIGVPLAAEFRKYEPDDLATCVAYFVLQRT